MMTRGTIVELADFTRHVVESCDLDSASIFLCDRVAATPRISHLFHHQITEEVKDRYERHAVFNEDPFTDPRIFEAGSSAEDGLILADDERVCRIRSANGRYWPFMYDHGIEVIGASTRRLQPGVYATIGFHRRRDRPHRMHVPVRRLDTLARRLQDMASGQILQHLLSRKEGLSSLRHACFQPPALPRGTNMPMPALSLREQEVTDLVCQGRLNKEIAYLLGLSEHTVENHLRRIYAKLSIHNRSALVAAMASDASRSH